MDLKDEELVSQTLLGDRDAFAVLVSRYQDRVYAYTLRELRNPIDAQDVTQEVFLRAYRHLGKLRNPHLFRTWLYTITTNECKRWLVQVTKRRRREILLEEVEAAEEEAVLVYPEHTLPTADWEVDLEEALSQLSDDNQIVVSMFYMSNCSMKEIAEFLGTSVNTVKGKLFRARQQLGNKLKKYDRTVKSHKLKGGFLAQVMRQTSKTPTPTVTFTPRRSTTVGKVVVALITGFCILIGGIAGKDDSTPRDLESRIGMGTEARDAIRPIEIVLLTADPNATVPATQQVAPRPSSTFASRSIEQQRGGRGWIKTPAFSLGLRKGTGKKGVFSGRVIDSDGVPVADAEILYGVRSDTLKPVLRTGVDGTFRFELMRSKFKGSRYVNVVATHPDYAFGWKRNAGQGTATITVQLSTPGELSGKIMNEAGQPIQDAEAQIQYVVRDSEMASATEDRFGPEGIPIAPVKTDANGAFLFRGVPKGTKLTLAIQGAGYAKATRSSVSVGMAVLEFRLKREGRIEGHLRYASSGAPVKNATVVLKGIPPTSGRENARTDANGNYLLKNLAPGMYTLFLDQGPKDWTAIAQKAIKNATVVLKGIPLTSGRENACTDANGNYLLKNLAPGMYTLFLDQGPKDWTAIAQKAIKVVEGKTLSNIDLTLIRGGFIVGRVTDQVTNDPIVNHPINLHDAARPESQTVAHFTKTDETGTYSFRATPGRAHVFAPAPSRYHYVGTVDKYVDVLEGKTVVVNFQFSSIYTPRED